MACTSSNAPRPWLKLLAQLAALQSVGSTRTDLDEHFAECVFSKNIYEIMMVLPDHYDFAILLCFT